MENKEVEVKGVRIASDQILVYDTLSVHGIPTKNQAHAVLGYLLNRSLLKIADWSYGYVTIRGICNSDTTNDVYAELYKLRGQGIIDWLEYPQVVNGMEIIIREYRFPRVLYLESKVNRHRKYISVYPAITRKALLVRDNHKCVYCGTPISINSLTLDHILPRSKGGETSWQNIVASCKKCNSLKGDMLLKDFLQAHPSMNGNIHAFAPRLEFFHRGKKKGRALKKTSTV